MATIRRAYDLPIPTTVNSVVPAALPLAIIEAAPLDIQSQKRLMRPSSTQGDADEAFNEELHQFADILVSVYLSLTPTQRAHYEQPFASANGKSLNLTFGEDHHE